MEFKDEEIKTEIIDETEAAQPHADNKKKYIIIAAVILVLAGVFLIFRNKVLDINMYSKYTVSQGDNLSYKEINGRFTDEANGMYFDFKAEKTKAEHTAELPEGELSADSAASETYTVSYDGTCQSGYTDWYVDEVLSSIYIEQNNMNEEYEKYLDEKGTALDDFAGFTAQKGVDRADLDAIDATNFVSQEAKSYIQNVYWKYNKNAGEITLYNELGKEISAFKIVGKELVSLSGYFEGTPYKNKRFTGEYTYTEDGYVEKYYFYNDGNFMVKMEAEGEIPQYYGGEYKADDKYIVINSGGRKMAYKKINTGLSSITLKKQ